MPQGLRQPRRAEWFQQVVDGVDLKRAQRVLIVSSDKNDRRIPPDQLQHLKAVQLRHLNIQKDEIRLQIVDGLNRLKTIGAFGHNLDVFVFGKVFLENRTRK